MISQILKDIDVYLIASHTTKGNHFTDDLYQELCLELLEHKTRVIELYNRKELRPYVYRIAWNTYNTRFGSFYKKYRQQQEPIEQLEGQDINLQDVLDRSNLTSIEREWLNVYLQLDCNKTWMESRTNISRKAITKHIKEITTKCKS